MVSSVNIQPLVSLDSSSGTSYHPGSGNSGSLFISGGLVWRRIISGMTELGFIDCDFY